VCNDKEKINIMRMESDACLCAPEMGPSHRYSTPRPISHPPGVSAGTSLTSVHPQVLIMWFLKQKKYCKRLNDSKKEEKEEA
jgi:hypothetical protein